VSLPRKKKTTQLENRLGFCGELMEFNYSLVCLLFFEEERKNKEKPSNSIRKQTWFSWRTNEIQSFIGWLLFLSFSQGVLTYNKKLATFS
jgi:hypothetical protein